MLILYTCMYLLLHSVISEVCETGECVNLKSCPSAIEDLKKRIKPVTCGFEMKDPKVCCTPSQPIESERISQLKCHEYYKKNKLIPMEIVSGVNVKEYEMPHMAMLGYGTTGDIDWSCGGSLISDTFVLTAAHCAETINGDVAFVKLGELDISSDTDIAAPKDFQVIEIHVHPDYALPSKYNDIALLKLNETVWFSKFMRPACLHYTYTISTDILVASGWGALEYAGDMHSALQKVDLKHFTRDTCSRFYKPAREMDKGILDESQICAGDEGKDTCQGDSGGPLQVEIPEVPADYDKHYTIVGITSLGKNCGHVPGIYTRVSHYLTWIEKIVWPLP